MSQGALGAVRGAEAMAATSLVIIAIGTNATALKGKVIAIHAGPSDLAMTMMLIPPTMTLAVTNLVVTMIGKGTWPCSKMMRLSAILPRRMTNHLPWPPREAPPDGGLTRVA